MAKILIKNGRVWDGERFFYADVLTEGDRISEIAPAVFSSADFVYDAKGKTVSAGFVDAHVHMRGVSADVFGVQAEMSCFPFGVTAAADASGDVGDESLLDSFMLKSLVFVGVGFQNNRADFTRTEEALVGYGARAVGLKVYFDTAISAVTDISPLREVCEFAHARGLRVMVHSSHSPVCMAEILRALGAGDILTHSFHGGVNRADEDGFASMREARERGVWIDVGMAGHVHTDFGVFEKALQCGITPDLISTDITKLSAYTRGGRYGMTMCMNIALSLGMREEDVFKAVTSNPARALGKEKEWGRLAVGRLADIAVLEMGDEGFDLTDGAGNRVYHPNGYRCVLTVADGQVVYKH